MKEHSRIHLRPWQKSDAPVILGWIKDLRSLRLWSADLYPSFPPKVQDMESLYAGVNTFPLTAVDDNNKLVGHLSVRIPDVSNPFSVRLGFVIVDYSLRGMGYGSEMIRLAVEYAKTNLQAQNISLGVFTDNLSALRCYESVGFISVGDESYVIDGNVWQGVEMTLK